MCLCDVCVCVCLMILPRCAFTCVACALGFFLLREIAQDFDPAVQSERGRVDIHSVVV